MKNSLLAFVATLFLLFSFSNSQPAKWENIGPGGGGAFYCPSFNPANPNEYYLTSDMSDLFHTTDFGNSYNIVNFQYITAGGASVQFTNDKNILYTINFNEFGTYPVVSKDGGTTWNTLKNDPTSGGAYFVFADPDDYNKVIVCDYSNVYYTKDAGNTFSKIFAGNSGTWGSYISGILWDGNDTYICQPDGLLISKNNGAFSSEKPTGISTTEFIISCSAAKQNGKIRFFAVTSTECWPGMTGSEHSAYKSVYTLDYGAASWTSKTNVITSGYHPFFAGMSKDNIDIAFLAGCDANSDGPTVLKTTDGGSTWQNVFILQNNKNIKTGWSGLGGDRNWTYGEYALGFAVCRTNPNYCIFTDLGFAHTTSDGGTTWDQAYVNKSDENPANSTTPTGKSYHSVGLENTSCWNLNWSDVSNIFAGYTDIKGCRSTDGGATWSFDYTGHSDNTMYYSLKHSNGNLYAATSSVHDMYESMFMADNRIDGGQGKVLMSTNKGKVWTTMHNFAHPVIWLAADPKNANRMYASVINSTSGGIYVSNDINNGASSTWTKLANPPRTSGHPYNILVLNDGSLLCTYSCRTDNNRKTFYASSGVFLSTDNGSSWLDKSTDVNLQYWVKDVVIDPNDATQNTWYAGVFSGWGGAANNKGGLYKTTNRGTSWTKILDKARVESCSFNPLNTNEMYASTEYEGLYFSNNAKSSTPTFNLVPNYPFKHPMRIFFNPYDQTQIYITAFGYGIVRNSNTTKPAPDKVLLTKPDNNSQNVDLSINAEWKTANNADSYTLQVSTDLNFNTFILNKNNIQQLTNPIPGLAANTTYYWRVRATNTIGDGAWSDIWKFTTKAATPLLPGKIVLVSPLDSASIYWGDTVTYKWLADSLANKYWIEFVQYNGDIVIDSAVVSNNYIKQGVSGHYWRVKAGNNSGWGPFSDTRVLNFYDDVTEIIKQDNIIYPNPTSDYLNIKSDFKTVSIIDIFGRSVDFKIVGTNIIDISALSTGIYFLKIDNKMFKVVKN